MVKTYSERKKSCSDNETKDTLKNANQQRLLMFLLGLNESYSHVRSDILLKATVPTVNRAYATVIQEESQRIIGYLNDFKSKRKQGQGDSNTGYRGQSMAYGTENGHRSNNFSHNYHALNTDLVKEKICAVHISDFRKFPYKARDKHKLGIDKE
ncbi:hypothetical protein H5410_063119 [Solanum commersonii]|uniref:Uncharacterized protein n=1 Tax=Solanum commersonii TaxID=4109 RepID=A0A9J5WCF4_SOLCO|nr:hypothetical protein H5410_063119 [Solanum commersonii]